jgi:hypothetical protein
MATGLDELIDYLLSEIALCGTQGTSGHSSNPSLTIMFLYDFWRTCPSMRACNI